MSMSSLIPLFYKKFSIQGGDGLIQNSNKKYNKYFHNIAFKKIILSNTPVTATSKTYQVALPATNTLTADNIANGISLSLNSTFGTTPSVLNINGSTLYMEETPWTAYAAIDPATIPVANNQLGGAIGTSPKAIGFDMCYFDYGINNISNSFTFDDATSQTITNNTPVSSAGIAMDNTSVTRTIETTCCRIPMAMEYMIYTK